MVSGNVTLGQVTDKAMILIIEAKDNHAGLILNQGQVSGSGFANVTLSWRDADGLKVLAAILEKLAAQP